MSEKIKKITPKVLESFDGVRKLLGEQLFQLSINHNLNLYLSSDTQFMGGEPFVLRWINEDNTEYKQFSLSIKYDKFEKLNCTEIYLIASDKHNKKTERQSPGKYWKREHAMNFSTDAFLKKYANKDRVQYNDYGHKAIISQKIYFDASEINMDEKVKNLLSTVETIFLQDFITLSRHFCNKLTLVTA